MRSNRHILWSKSLSLFIERFLNGKRLLVFGNWMESGFVTKTKDWFPVLVLGLWARLMKEESIKANGFGV